MKIFLSFDNDYLEDYEYLPKIFETIDDTPCTFFLVGNRHPDQPICFPETCQIGNHSFLHEEWYGKSLQDRMIDLRRNHEFIKEKYGIECKVYRSPHLRNFPDTKKEMEKIGYKPEMDCMPCPFCGFMVHEHLKQYFSSHHYFKETNNNCPKSFLETFEYICKQGEDFTFFLDPHHFNTPEKLEQLKELIKIGKQYGQFELL